MKKNIFWGVVLIAAAILLLFGAIGLGPDIPLFKIGLGILCLAWLISTVIKGKISGIFFPLAFIFMLFEKEIGVYYLCIGEDIISNWIVLLCALLLTIGFGMLFGNIKFRLHKGHIFNSATNKNSFNEGVKYIDSATFKYETIKNSLGQFDIYFQNLDAYEGGGTIEVCNKLGETNIYLPADWNIETNIDNTMGEVHVNGTGATDGKKIKIVGKNKLGEVNIHIR